MKRDRSLNSHTFPRAEAYEILKEKVALVQPPLDPHDDQVEFIESLPWPPVHSPVTLERQPPTQHNLSQYEYIVYDEPEPRRRVARLVRSLKRLDVASAGIYHPTLVPMEDKRIAGVSLAFISLSHSLMLPPKSSLSRSLMNVQPFAARAIKFNGSSQWQRGNDLHGAIKCATFLPR